MSMIFGPPNENLSPPKIVATVKGEHRKWNAILITAAPDLLEACETVLRRINRSNVGGPEKLDPNVILLEKVIAKAKGAR